MTSAYFCHVIICVAACLFRVQSNYNTYDALSVAISNIECIETLFDKAKFYSTK